MFAFLKHNFRWIAGGFLLKFVSSFVQTFFVSASVGEWQSKFHVSHGEFGRLYMFATLVSTLCLPFVGRLVDVVPEHRTVRIVVPILAAAMFIGRLRAFDRLACRHHFLTAAIRPGDDDAHCVDRDRTMV